MTEISAASGKRLTELATQWDKSIESWLHEDMLRATVQLNQPVLGMMMQPNAAWSLRTTATEYGKFLVHACSFEAMRQPQVKLNSDISWGLGSALEHADGREWFYHSGDNPGFKNLFVMEAKTRSGMVIFTNGDSGLKLYQRIARNGVGRDFSLFLS